MRVNPASARLLGTMGLGEGHSLLDALLAANGLRLAIENWPEVAQHMISRLRTESRHVGGDPLLDGAADRLAQDLDAADSGQAIGILPAVVTTRLRTEAGRLTLYSTIAQFATAEDIAIAELKIELLFPADEATRSLLMDMANTV